MPFGVYISGPGIVGRLLMRDPDGPITFEAEGDAEHYAASVRPARPYHFVTVRPYEAGDETCGRYAAHPDGVT